jgi:hypothetical protein
MNLPAERTLRCATIISALAIVLACNDKGAIEQRKGRKKPTCAVQDCASGKIVDDGCDESGRCASCVNSCTSGVPPSAAPITR